MEIIPPKQTNATNGSYQKSPGTAPSSAGNSQTSGQMANFMGRFRGFGSTVGLFLAAFIIAIFLNSFVIQSYQVDGQSMEPTLQNDDRLIVNKLPRTLARIDGHQYVPHRGDIIIFNQEGLPGFIGQKQLIKRVVGLPGERVVVTGGKVTVYNNQYPDGFNPDRTGLYQISAPTTNGEADITLQKDQLFVCGDNRPNSEDSRFFGPINTNQVVAKLVLRILPINNTKTF